jgi:hypothetical protein
LFLALFSKDVHKYALASKISKKWTLSSAPRRRRLRGGDGVAASSAPIVLRAKHGAKIISVVLGGKIDGAELLF